jgi:hypothetical protein
LQTRLDALTNKQLIKKFRHQGGTANISQNIWNGVDSAFITSSQSGQSGLCADYKGFCGGGFKGVCFSWLWRAEKINCIDEVLNLHGRKERN